jgi:hypothetical protein
MAPLPRINLDADTAVKEGMKLFRGASKLSISLALVITTSFFGISGTIWWNKDTIVAIVNAAYSVEHIRAAHHECQLQVASLNARVAENEKEIRELKQTRVAATQ